MPNQRQRGRKSLCPGITAILAAAVLLSAGFYFYGSASPVQEGVAGDPDAAEKKAAVEMREQVERHGITWTFDQEYPVGQYVNGDPCPFGYPAVTNQPTEHQELRANSDHYEGTGFAETMWDTYR